MNGNAVYVIKKYKCNVCPNRILAPLNKNAVFAHLSGNSQAADDVIGIYPMTEDECCYFLAIDFDDDDWSRDVTAFCGACAELGSSEKPGKDQKTGCWR